VIGGVHSAQRKGKTCESEREQGNKSREIIKGERGVEQVEYNTIYYMDTLLLT